jgi:hypothetical protein
LVGQAAEADVGVDEATPVTEDYKEFDNVFTGNIRKVIIEFTPTKKGAADKAK